MTWKHANHEVIMMQEVPVGPGKRFGPYCLDCDETFFYMIQPTEADIEKAREWWEIHGDTILSGFEDANEGRTFKRDLRPSNSGDRKG